MGLQQLLIIVHCFIALAASQGDENTCKCSSSVIVMSKDELALEIQSQVATALARGILTLPSSLNISGIVTNIMRDSTEDLFARVEKSTDELFEKVEALMKPITIKLAQLEQPGIFPSHPASSCKEILNHDKNTASGYYWLRASNGTAVKIYCSMGTTCGNQNGGWMKVTELDMTNITHQCPEPLSSRVKSSKRLCHRSLNSGCASVLYSINGIRYNEVCGKIIGYQQGTPDALLSGTNVGYGLNGPYVDGVSLTHGSPKQHIWTFAAALHEGSEERYRQHTCYCSNRNVRGPAPPSFVGQDYFCDTGNPHYLGIQQFQTFFDDPLWDGAGCGPTNECCTFNSPPWFYKKLNQNTNENIEMRICTNDSSGSEEVFLQQVVIYVR